MKNYSNKKRFDALNRHKSSLSISDNNAYTPITQHIRCDSIETFADTIINTERFNKIYKYDNVGRVFRLTTLNSSLYKKRHQIFFEENRKLSREEHQLAVSEDNAYAVLVDKINKEKAMKKL